MCIRDREYAAAIIRLLELSTVQATKPGKGIEMCIRDSLWGWGKPYHGKFIVSIALAVLGVACQMVPYFCVAHIVTLMLSGDQNFSHYTAAVSYTHLSAGPDSFGNLCA